MILFVQAVKSHVMEINMYVTVNFKDCHCIHPNENLVLPMAGEKRLNIFFITVARPAWPSWLLVFQGC